MPRKFTQQQVLGVHRDVGLELADPPPARVLQAEQVLAGGGQGARGDVGQALLDVGARAARR